MSLDNFTGCVSITGVTFYVSLQVCELPAGRTRGGGERSWPRASWKHHPQAVCQRTEGKKPHSPAPFDTVHWGWLFYYVVKVAGLSFYVKNTGFVIYCF